ncbi:MAG: hypothetical protein KatS3mg004_0274 [Bryobacteraceae bacterium]|nr:MAG: hypothetical protein KatS3mg004_0274 [Bryobacteraceae bacterium]
MMKRAFGLAALLVLGTVAGWGYTINLLDPGYSGRLWNTGWTSGGTYGTNDAQDGHYTWVRWADANRTTISSSGPAYIINDAPAFPFPYWRANESNVAAWVSTSADAPNIGQGAWFSWSTTFTLPSLYPEWNITLNFSVWADNRPEAIRLLSGSTVLASVATNYTGNQGHVSTFAGGPYSLTAMGLAPGTYTIRFDTYNASGSTGNPTGLFVRFNEAAALGIPEPSTYALMGTVGLALYLIRRRKKSTRTQA